MSDMSNRLDLIRAETDQNRKNLRVAEVVSELFRAVGAEPVIVGGSAVEFYTDGAYVSGDVDICSMARVGLLRATAKPSWLRSGRPSASVCGMSPA